jgi:Domain of unknown function (DUF4349)
MLLNLQAIGPEIRQRLKTGCLALAGLTALYLSIQPLQQAKEVRNQEMTGLGSVRGETLRETVVRKITRGDGVVGGVAGGESLMTADALPQSASVSPSAIAQDERKLVRTSGFELVVKAPAEAAEEVRQLAERSGGYLVSSQVQGFEANASATVSVRVPVTQFEAVREQIRRLGLRVESDKIEAQDVTRDYVDRDSRLRNQRAQEQQYLQILKRATTVKDTLEVSNKLNEVRGQIEQQQAEFDALSKQIETVTITVELRSDAEDQVLGLHWRPLYRIKAAMQDGLDGLGEYVASMTSFAFLLPTILLWLITLVAGAAIGWRLLRWIARKFFNFPKTAKAVS